MFCGIVITEHYEPVYFSHILHFENILVPDLHSTRNYDCFSPQVSLTNNGFVNHATLEELQLIILAIVEVS